MTNNLNFALLIERSNSPILIFSQSGQLLYANDASLPVIEHFNCELQQNLSPEWMTKFKELDNPSQAKVFEFQSLGLDIEITVTLSGDENNNFYVFGRDVTRERLLEKEHLELSKKESVEAMITTFCHEIANPIAIAMGYTSQNFSRLTEDKIKKVHNALLRVANILDKMRALPTKNIQIVKYIDKTQMVQLETKDDEEK